MLLVSMSAPGCSAFNYIERRIEPLSKALVGLALNHSILSSHLDNDNGTNDDELEKKNLKSCGEILSTVWSERKLDDDIVKCEYRSNRTKR